MANDQPKVSIITVNYNGKEFLDEFFTSLANLDYPQKKIEIILVDNGSTDASLASVKKQCPHVITIKNKVNNYARANNLGIKKARGDYIALLNPDTKVDTGWLNELVTVLHSDDTIGAAGSKILLMDGRIHSTGHIEYPNFHWADRGFQEPDEGQYDIQTEMPSLCGCALLFKRQCLESVGPFDEDFNMYLEDVDLAKRCYGKGWKMVYVPKSIVHHHYHGIMPQDLEEFYVQRNRLLIVAKYWPAELPSVIRTLEQYIQRKGSVSEERVWSMVRDMVSKVLKTQPKGRCFELLPPLMLEVSKLFSFRNDILLGEIGALNDTLAREHASLVIKGSELETSEDEVCKREELFKTTIADFQKRIEEQNGALCSLRNDMNTKEIELGGIRQELDEANKAAQALRDVIRDNAQRIEERERRIAALESDLAGRHFDEESSRQSYIAAVEEQNALINQHKKELVAKDELIKSLTEDMERELIKYNEDMRSKEDRIRDAEASLSTIHESLTSVEAVNNELRDRINEKEKVYQGYEQSMRRLREELEAQERLCVVKDHFIKGLEESMVLKAKEWEAELESALRDLKAKLNEKEGILQDKMQQFNERLRHLEGLLRERDETVERITREMGQGIRVRDQELQSKDSHFKESMRAKEDLLRAKEHEYTMDLCSKNEIIHNLEAELNAIDRMMSEQENEIQQLRDHIEAFYASNGYRFVLQPLINIVQPVKSILRKR
ncbi:MAG: glycosyltransferase [Candidatus Omnitrophica bacterium]|nr:glycosyltransferase [Candidatus Omnitrophota bacterium]